MSDFMEVYRKSWEQTLSKALSGEAEASEWVLHVEDTYTVRVQVPQDAWRQRESGKPGYVEWGIYRITGTQVSGDDAGQRCYWRKGADSSLDGVTSLDEAEPDCEGSVKWDGCGDFTTSSQSQVHVCDIEDVAHFGYALVLAYKMSLEMVGGGL